jgi:hypothetical protein
VAALGASLVLGAAAFGALGGVAAVRADPASAPICEAATLERSDELAGTPILVSPAPGSLDAMPQTQLSFLGAPASQLGALTVSGSISGVHSGRLEAYSQGDGASFLPDTPFSVGETVSVSGSWNASGVAHAFAYSFTVGDPDPIARLPESGKPAGPPGSVWHFRSAPGIDPAVLTVTRTSAPARGDGDIFLATYPGPGATGPAIYAPSGRLVWFKPLGANTFAADLKVARYEGRRVLTWWQGTISNHGFGLGEGEIYSDRYQHLATVRAGDGLAEDLHELDITAAGTALITAWKPLYCDLSAFGGPAVSAVYDGVFQQIDIRTGLVMSEWDSLDHVPLSDSYMPASGASVAWPYDWFHLNSIALEPDGSVLISARSTWAVYDIDAASGQIEWQSGGRDPSFAMGPGTTTAWQHYAQPLGDDSYSVFDNAGSPQSDRRSRGLVVAIDRQTQTTRLLAKITAPRPIYAQTQGDLQLLPDGNWWIGWGDVNQASEISPSGRLLFEAQLPNGAESYRTLRFPWRAQPATRPAVAVSRASGELTRVYASWNGATAVLGWRLLGGASPGRLEAVESAAQTGFETVLRAPATLRYVMVEALGGGGRVLAASRAVRVPR